MSNKAIFRNYEKAKEASSTFRDRWNDLLDLAYAKISKDKEGKAKSGIKDGSLSSIVYERACRVAAQPATGKILPLTRHDEGKSQLINLVWNRYCIPRMNWQYPLPTKLRMWEYYSLIYGLMPMFHGYHIDDAYIGPDCRLVDPRFVFPQAGRLSPNDCEKVYYETFHSAKALKEMIKTEGYQAGAIQEILEARPEGGGPSLDEQLTNLQEERGEDSNLHTGQIKLVTEYVRGVGSDWTTFAPDYGNKVVRKIKNPFTTGRIPIVFKYAMPIIDSFWGLGDVERGESLQRGIDTVLNLGSDYMKIMLFPPTIFSQGMNVSQYKIQAGAKWIVANNQKIDTFHQSNLAPQVEQQLYQAFKGSLMNQNGTTDTMISASDKLPGYGKTPDALKKLDSRENARDSWDREMLELAEQELFEGMIEELGIKQKHLIDFNIFDEEIKQIADAGFGDVLEAFDSAVDYWVDPITDEKFFAPDDTTVKQKKLIPKLKDTGVAKLTVKPEVLVGKYKFNIDTNSTQANDEAEEFERLNMLLELMQTPAAGTALEQLRQAGREFDMGALLEQLVRSANVKNADKLFKDIPESELVEPEESQEGEMQPPAELPAEEGEVFSPELIQDPMLQQALMQGGAMQGGGV